MTEPYCPECELRELQSKITRQSIEESVSKMAFVKGINTPAAEYERRLSICMDCPSLRSQIMCAECGTYVAYRARILSAKCPSADGDKWAKK